MPTFSEKAHLRKLYLDVKKHEGQLAEARAKLEAFDVYLRSTGTDPEKLLNSIKEENAPSTSEPAGGAAPFRRPRGGLKEAIADVLTEGKEMSVNEILAALKKNGTDPASSDPVSYLRTILATHFSRVPGKRGYYKCTAASTVETTSEKKVEEVLGEFGVSLSEL